MKKSLFGILGALLFGVLVALILKFRPAPSQNAQNNLEQNASSEVVPVAGDNLALPPADPKNSELGASELIIYTWANYTNPEIYQLFEKEYGIKIKEENFDSNDTLRSKLRSGDTPYDIVVPSDFSLQQLIQQGLLAELDFTAIMNLHNVMPRFLSLYSDPQNKYSVPYLWGTTGLGYNTSKVSPPPSSWADIFEPQRLASLTNRVSMLDDARESIGAALKYLGYSLNSRNPEELEKARQVLERQKPAIARYDTDTFRDFLISGDMFLVHAWSSDVARAHTQRSEVRYVLPKEGGSLWADSLAIPKTSKHKKAAEAFINFILRPEIGAKLINELKFPCANEAARALIKPEILEDHNIFPTEEAFAKLEWIQDVGEATPLYEKIWADLKAK